MPRLARRFIVSAVLGGIAWPFAWAALPEGEHRTIVAMVLMGALVVVSLGLARVAPSSPVRRSGEWLAVPVAQFLGAVALVAAFAIPGDDAAWLTVPWLGVTLWVAALRWAEPMSRTTRNLCGMAAVAYLPVGAGWAMLARFGYQPLGFAETIVILTAAHFHFAGLAFPILAGEIAERVRSRIANGFALSAVGAVPLVALGITSTQLGGPRGIELGAAFLLAIPGFGLGALQVRLAFRYAGFTGLCLATSGLCLAIALAWSAIYAGGQYGLWTGVDIPFMVRWHGIVNAVGSALIGLIGWNLFGDAR